MPPVPADPTVVHPMPEQPRVVLLKPLITSPLIEVGDFSYYDDPDDPTAFDTRNVLYHYGPERLVIGKFCALGEGVRFIMNGANHRMDGPSTFPFPVMGGSWAEHFDLITGLTGRGDTVVGHDVWFGYRSMVMPGVRIGHGAIIASGSVVVDDVPDYGIVGGNPARLIRRRYSDADINRLLALAWWDWPLQRTTEHIRSIMSGSIDDLENAAPGHVEKAPQDPTPPAPRTVERTRPRTTCAVTRSLSALHHSSSENRAVSMPASPHHNPFADWLRTHAVPLDHLDPEAPLDDLEPLRAVIGDARVVAIGESSHFIDEFASMRERILRFLAERCGFTVLAFEYGFSEGFTLDAWAKGEGTDDDLSAHLAGTIPVGVDEPLRRIRRHNRTASPPVRFAGIDIPAAGGSLLPALAPVADYLRRIDPETLPVVREAMRIAKSFAGGSGAVAAPAWARLATTEQDALSATLTRLLIRFRSVEPLYVSRGDQRSYDIAVRRLEGACHADYTFRAMADLFAGKGLTADTSARDVYMAESVLWHLERFEPGTRVVLAAHNAHIQKTPVSFSGHLTGLPMGQHLHRALGDEYVALALTSTTGHTADMPRDENTPFGFTIDATALEPPEPGSIEAAFADAELGLSIADLHQARPQAAHGNADLAPGPDRIRIQSAYLHTPVLEAFDAILHIPTSTVADNLENL